jgi:hypothetical protein
MTNMLPRDRAELIMAEHAAGQSIREIAKAYGHSTQTIRDYVLGRRTPGEPAARDDDFAPFAAYCRRRLADDPHLRAAALLAEITGLGFPGTTRTFTGRWNGTRSSRIPARTATSRESAATSCSHRHGSRSRSRCQCRAPR